jgi:type IV secretion system protein VirB4
MSHFDALKTLRREVGISKNVSITHLNSPCIFESSNSMIAMVLKLEGVTFDAERNEVLNQHKRAWHRAVVALDDRFALYQTTHRHKESMRLDGDFENVFCRELDTAYHERFRNSHMYVNDLYLTVIYKGITSGKAGKGLSFVRKLMNHSIKGAREAARHQQIKHLKRALDQLKMNLAAFSPRLLGEQDEALGYSELIRFLSLPINAGLPIQAPFTHIATPIGQSLLDAKKEQTRYPHGNLSQFLSKGRLFFGDYIQFQGETAQDTRFAAIMTIKQYGVETGAIMLDSLLHLDAEFIATHSYAVEAKNVSLDRVDKHRRRMLNVGDKALSQIGDLEILDDNVASERVTMGYHHNTVMLLAENKEALESKINACSRCYTEAGFVAVRETIGQEPAFWAQIPTNMKYIARSSLVTSENFVDFASLHNYRTGYMDQNHLGSAVTVMMTPSKTPYLFNFHQKSKAGNPSKGHALILGGNDAGKTVFMTFTDAQEKRYHGRSFVFDYHRGQAIYCRAKGGAYAVLSPNHPEDCHFSPLQLEDTPENRAFNHRLLVQMCLEDEKDKLSGDMIKALEDCIHYAYDDLAPEHRTLSNAVKILPVDFQHKASLSRWLRSEGAAHDGAYAYLFDNQVDQLMMHDDMGFDMTHFLDHEPVHVRTIVTMYLFHRIHLVLDGTLTRIDLDEAAQYYEDPYWQTMLGRILPTWRKRNAHLVQATQSVATILNVPDKLRKAILDNLSIMICFPNPQADEQEYIDGLNLTQAEFGFIKHTNPHARLFLLKDANTSVIAKLDLGHLDDALAILSSNEASVTLLDKIRSEVGSDPVDWMPIFQARKKRMLSNG